MARVKHTTATPGTYKLTPELRARLISAAAIGTPYSGLAVIADISDDTLLDWRNRIPGFQADLTRARLQSEPFYLSAIDQAARNGDWRAAAHMLKILFPERYNETLQLSGTMNVSPVRPNDAEAKLAREIRDDPEATRLLGNLVKRLPAGALRAGILGTTDDKPLAAGESSDVPQRVPRRGRAAPDTAPDNKHSRPPREK